MKDERDYFFRVVIKTGGYAYSEIVEVKPDIDTQYG